jgi:hypothetical protein
MSRRMQLPARPAGVILPVFGIALLLGLAGCDKADRSIPSQSPPRPTTWGGHVFTADMQLTKLPRPADPGQM